VEIGEVRVWKHLLGVRWHLQARRTHVARECRVGKTVRSETRSSRRRSLCFAAVALRAADFHVSELPLLHVACRRWLRLRLRRQDRGAQESGTHDTDDEERLHHRGWVITSSRAGWPRLTAAIARASDGPRSSGLAIGPSAYQPI